MNMLINCLKEKVKNNKRVLIYCFAVTFIIGLTAHAYMYFQDSFSHDSLNEFNGAVHNAWKIEIGRYIVPLYRALTRGTLTLPWLIGISSLLWIALSVFFTAKLFNVQSKSFLVLTSGIYTANIAVIATTATFMHDLDSYMFALFLSVLAVYLWKTYRYGFLFSSVCVFALLGVYQSYISVTVTLVIICLILQLLAQEKFKTVFWAGIKSVWMLLIGGVSYYVGLKIVFYYRHIEAVNTRQSVDNIFSLGFMGMVQSAVETYQHTIRTFLVPEDTVLPNKLLFLITLILVGVAGLIVLLKLFSGKIKIKEKLLCLLLIAILPFTMNIAKILSGGIDHDLMRFAIWLAYLFALLIVYKANEFCWGFNEKPWFSAIAKNGKRASILIVSIILISNIVLANEIYLKKDFEQDATLSFFTRVVEKMDSFDEYDRKEIPVVFVGQPDVFEDKMAGFENTETVIGANFSVLGSAMPSYYSNYFRYKLNYSIIVTKKDEAFYEDPTIVNMPAFPEDGSLKMVDGVLVVKLG